MTVVRDQSSQVIRKAVAGGQWSVVRKRLVRLRQLLTTDHRPLTTVAIFAFLLAGCLDTTNQPGITPDPEQAALNVYPDIPDSSQAMKDAERGSKLFRQFTCQSCHSTDRERRNLVGPPLGGVSDRVLARHNNDSLESRRWLVKHVKDAQRFPGEYAGHPDYPGFMTPNPRLTDEDLRAVVEYLWSLR